MKKSPAIKYLLYTLGICVFFTACEDDEGQIKAGEVSAEFTTEATTIQTHDLVQFQDQSTGDVTSWSWFFEGGTPETSHEQNPEVIYQESGNFDVKLVVSNAGYTDVALKENFMELTLAPQPITADFSADKLNALTGEAITLTDESTGNPTEWSWEFTSETGTTLTASEENPEVTFSEPGAYDVKLTASNGIYTGEEFKEDYLTIIDPSAVAANFEVDSRLTYSGQQVQFTDISVGTVTQWEWTFEGGTPATSTDQNPVVTFSTPGRFEVTLAASNETNASTKEETDYMSVIPGDGLLALLPFNGNSDDEGPLSLTVDDSNSGATYNASDRGGIPNSTLTLDGTGILRIPATAEKQLGTSGYAVGVWMKTDIPEQMWVWQEGSPAFPHSAWFRFNNSFGSLSFLPHIGGIVKNTGSSLSDGLWHYVVCTRSAAGISKVYVDGELVADKVTTNQDLTNDIGFIIGGKENGDGSISFYYTGQLDDLVIYNRALSEAEIIQMSE